MNATIVASLVAAAGGVFSGIASYLFTKQRERDADLRKERLGYYKTFVDSISGIVEGQESTEGQEAFSRACNNLLLFAPVPVIEALYRFQTETSASNPNRNQNHDKVLTDLMRAIRHDLGIKPSDDTQFTAMLWSAGTRQNALADPET